MKKDKSYNCHALLKRKIVITIKNFRSTLVKGLYFKNRNYKFIYYEEPAKFRKRLSGVNGLLATLSFTYLSGSVESCNNIFTETLGFEAT